MKSLQQLLGIEALRAELKAPRSATSSPYKVEFFCHAQSTPDASREAAWTALPR